MGKKKKTNSISLFVFVMIIYILMTREGTGSKKTNYNSPKRDHQNLIHIDWPAKLSEGEKVSENLTRKNYYIVYDGSGSMKIDQCAAGSTKEKVAKQAVNQFINQINEQDNVGLFIFDSNGASERVPLGINNRDALISSISNSSAKGGTPLKRAIESGVNSLAKQAGKQLEYGEYHLVVITDGQARGRDNPEDIVASALVKTPIVLHTVGFCIDSQHSLNQPGKILYKSADNPQALSEGLSSVLAEAEDFVVTDFN